MFPPKGKKIWLAITLAWILVSTVIGSTMLDQKAEVGVSIKGPFLYLLFVAASAWLWFGFNWIWRKVGEPKPRK